MRGDTDSQQNERSNKLACAGRTREQCHLERSSAVCLSRRSKSRAARPEHVSSSRCQNKQSGHTTVSGNMYVMMSRSRRASPKPPKALQECVCSGAGPPGGSRLAPAREGRKRHEHAKRRLVSRFGLVRGGRCMELVAFAASFYCDPVVYRTRNASSSRCNA